MWLLLSLVASAAYGLVGSPSAIASLLQYGMPIIAILVAPLVAGFLGGVVAGRMSGVVGSIAGYVVVSGFVLSIVSSPIALAALGAVIGLPLIVVGHLAGVAVRPPRVQPV